MWAVKNYESRVRRPGTGRGGEGRLHGRQVGRFGRPRRRRQRDGGDGGGGGTEAGVGLVRRAEEDAVVADVVVGQLEGAPEVKTGQICYYTPTSLFSDSDVNIK